MADTYQYVAGHTYKLYGSGITSVSTSITLIDFTDIYGNSLTMADFGTIGHLVLEPKTTKTEIVSFTGVTVNGDGTSTLTGVTRGLKAKAPYDAGGFGDSHSGGSIAIVSNPPQLYDKISNKANDETVAGVWTFTDPNVPRLDASHAYVAGEEQLFVTKEYADNLSFAGAPDGTTTSKGIFEEATLAEIDAGTAAGATGARLAVNPSTLTFRLPTSGQKDALVGTGTPSSTDPYVSLSTLLGVITPYAGYTAPTGWLLCDGAAVSRATYANLFSLLNPVVATGTFTVTLASPGVFTLVAHGLVIDDGVYFTTTGALPTGLTANTRYFVVSVPTADTFTVSATKGGAAINTSVSQSGVHTARRSAYGVGDGSTTFNVPSLKGLVPVGRDSSATEFNAVGETGGAKTHTLTVPEMPDHTHTPTGGGTGLIAGAGAPLGGGAYQVDPIVLSSVGGGGAHNNLQPYISLNYIIKT